MPAVMVQRWMFPCSCSRTTGRTSRSPKLAHRHHDGLVLGVRVLTSGA